VQGVNIPERQANGGALLVVDLPPHAILGINFPGPVIIPIAIRLLCVPAYILSCNSTPGHAIPSMYIAVSGRDTPRIKQRSLLATFPAWRRI
jgi:hypothetical protein